MGFILRTKLKNIFRAISFDEIELNGIGGDSKKLLEKVSSQWIILFKWIDHILKHYSNIFSTGCSRSKLHWNSFRGNTWWICYAHWWWQCKYHLSVQKLLAFFYWNLCKLPTQRCKYHDWSKFGGYAPSETDDQIIIN